MLIATCASLPASPPRYSRCTSRYKCARGVSPLKHTSSKSANQSCTRAISTINPRQNLSNRRTRRRRHTCLPRLLLNKFFLHLANAVLTNLNEGFVDLNIRLNKNLDPFQYFDLDATGLCDGKQISTFFGLFFREHQRPDVRALDNTSLLRQGVFRCLSWADLEVGSTPCVLFILVGKGSGSREAAHVRLRCFIYSQ
jgi:hypothetical protein